MAMLSHYQCTGDSCRQSRPHSRRRLEMMQLDPKWTLASKLDSNPMVWMIMVNGFIIDARNAPYEIQEQAYHAGIIPYIPLLKSEK